MASLKIPDTARIGLKKLASIGDEQFEELFSALEAMPPRIRHYTVFDDQTISPQSIAASDFSMIKGAVFPLLMAGANLPVSVSEYVDDVADAVNEMGEPLSATSVGTLKERLNKLLAISSTQLVAKAYDVLTEHGCTYSSSRVLSDIRPIFSDNVESLPKAAVTIHMLNMTHLKGGDARTFVVALDIKDLQELIDVLERAKKKNETLKSSVEASGMTYIDVV